jgi:hypothetical protein
VARPEFAVAPDTPSRPRTRYAPTATGTNAPGLNAARAVWHDGEIKKDIFAWR